MNTEKVKLLFDKIAANLILIGEDKPLVDVFPIEGRGPNIVFLFSWGIFGKENMYITEQGLDEAVVNGNEITLDNTDGDEITINFYNDLTVINQN